MHTTYLIFGCLKSRTKIVNSTHSQLIFSVFICYYEMFCNNFIRIGIFDMLPVAFLRIFIFLELILF